MQKRGIFKIYCIIWCRTCHCVSNLSGARAAEQGSLKAVLLNRGLSQNVRPSSEINPNCLRYNSSIDFATEDVFISTWSGSKQWEIQCNVSHTQNYYCSHFTRITAMVSLSHWLMISCGTMNFIHCTEIIWFPPGCAIYCDTHARPCYFRSPTTSGINAKWAACQHPARKRHGLPYM